MEDLTFGEQVKIVLSRRGMTIKRLAELIEQRTGKKMSRQNLTQRLGRDNFQEQDMRLIAEILECPFQLNILSGEVQPQERAAARFVKPAPSEEPYENPVPEVLQAEEDSSGETDPGQNVTSENLLNADNEYSGYEEMEQLPEETEAAAVAEPEDIPEEAEYIPAETADTGNGTAERDMTIGELYEIHEELSELEENAKAGEPVEAIKEELEKPKKERFSFFRRKHSSEYDSPVKAHPSSGTDTEENIAQGAAEMTDDQSVKHSEPADSLGAPEDDADFEPVITHNDAAEDKEVGEINPYTGREYQSNSVRMHPTRIGYVQVYDRNIHKWTDMTEWAFLGYQERKKALLGKAYEPPIYLD